MRAVSLLSGHATQQLTFRPCLHLGGLPPFGQPRMISLQATQHLYAFPLLLTPYAVGSFAWRHLLQSTRLKLSMVALVVRGCGGIHPQATCLTGRSRWPPALEPNA